MAGINREPKNAEMLSMLGYIEKTQAQVSMISGNGDTVALLSKAATYFKEALETDPDNISALNGMANMYFFANDFDRAIKLGSSIVQKEPNYGAALWDLALALENRINEVGTLPNYITALEIVYKRLKSIIPGQPEVFSAKELSYVQERLREIRRLSRAQNVSN